MMSLISDIDLSVDDRWLYPAMPDLPLGGAPQMVEVSRERVTCVV